MSSNIYTASYNTNVHNNNTNNNNNNNNNNIYNTCTVIYKGKIIM